jgi:hypothetical protein
VIWPAFGVAAWKTTEKRWHMMGSEMEDAFGEEVAHGFD